MPSVNLGRIRCVIRDLKVVEAPFLPPGVLAMVVGTPLVKRDGTPNVVVIKGPGMRDEVLADEMWPEDPWMDWLPV